MVVMLPVQILKARMRVTAKKVIKKLLLGRVRTSMNARLALTSAIKPPPHV